MTRGIPLTYDEAASLLDRAVEEKGEDYVHQGECVYFEDSGAPACIVGHVLSYKGVTRDDLVCEQNGFVVYAVNEGASVDVLVDEGIIECDPHTAGLLNVAQTLQDSRKTWEFSVREAKTRMSEFAEDSR